MNDHKKNKAACAQLFSALSDDLLMQVSTKKGVKDIWESLEARYIGADRVKASEALHRAWRV